MICTNTSCGLRIDATHYSGDDVNASTPLSLMATCPHCGQPMVLSSRDMLKTGGLLGITERKEQLELSEAIEDALIEGTAFMRKHAKWNKRLLSAGRSPVDIDIDAVAPLSVIAEGGTGVGKTLAYLVPALAMGSRIIVSTANKALQSQIMEEDGPWILEALKKEGIVRSMELLKGKSNYVCLLRAGEVRRRSPKEGAQVSVWEEDIQSQDIDAMPSTPRWIDDVRVDACAGMHCEKKESCLYYMRKEWSKEAHVVVTNHATLMMEHHLQLKTGGSMQNALCGARTALIIDEAHALPDVALGTTDNTLNISTLQYMKRLAKGVSGRSGNAAFGTSVAGIIDTTIRLLTTMYTHYMPPKGTLLLTMDPTDPENVPNLYALCESVAQGLEAVNEAAQIQLTQASKLVAASRSGALSQDADACMEVYSLATKLSRLTERAHNMFFNQSNYGDLYCLWLDRGAPGSPHAFDLCSSPVSASVVLRKFWDSCPVILTSATISSKVKGVASLSKFCQDVGYATDKGHREVIVQSPFDYANKCVVYATGIPQLKKPSVGAKRADAKERWEKLMAAEILRWAELTDGYAMVLCASRQDMETLSSRFKSSAKGSQYFTLVQGDVPKELLAPTYERLATDAIKRGHAKGPVVFGLKSIWEGISVKGPALRNVIIPRIPFHNHTNPVFMKQSKRLFSFYQKLNWPDMYIRDIVFNRLQLYDTGVQLRQATGRLIRTVNDTGIVCILDPRLTTSDRLKPVIAELPVVHLGKNTTDNPTHAAQWYANHILPTIRRQCNVLRSASEDA